MNVLEKVQSYLDQYNLGLKIIELKEDTSTCELAAAALGVEVGQIAKTLVFLADGQPVLVVASGDRKINSGKLKRLLAAVKVRMADPGTVLEVTGYPVGGVCPLALPESLPIFLESTMQRFGVVYAAAGTPNSALPVTMRQLEIITGGKWADLI
ncbi:Cys-tRNA(Pro)/Cys-tRNA(Cys) deacylase YbaK [Pelotomaculum sp. FP]|nr:YbaK/EbsC family protein [Pelotomaculum sp. FP]TEB11412.1 Cys-tRNA(Pro)/Cys-tRNA(Cys) deacylase YbaK [Pelotomaculum sp. FP]